MYFIFLLTLIYLCIIIFQYIYLKYIIIQKPSELDLKIKYNNENKNKLTNDFIKILNERVSLLHSKQMNYEEWLNYNNTNILNDIDNNEYYIFIYEKVFDTDDHNFVCKAHANKKYINLSWQDILKDTTENLVFTKYTTDKNLILNMYGLADTNEGSDIQYYWVDALTQKSVAKQSRVLRWYDNISRKSGIIGIGFDFEDLDIINRFIYYEKIYFLYPIFVSLLTFFMSIILYKLKDLRTFNYKPIIFLIITNLYILLFLGSFEFYGSNKTEFEKETNINSGILSVSFLVGVNIFILTTLQKSLKKDLFIESGFVFSVSLILLLIATFKSTNYMTINDVIKLRLSEQFIFNFSIILNTLIIINYIIYILSIKFKK